MAAGGRGPWPQNPKITRLKREPKSLIFDRFDHGYLNVLYVQGFGMIAERASARRGWRLALRGGRGGAEGPAGKQLQYDSNHADHHRLGISVL